MPLNLRAKPVTRGVAAALAATLLASTAALAAPPIRTSADNQVPACVSPERLMAFVRDRNETLDPRYAEIARFYKYYGEAWRVRWDYAFYQMILETNYLKFRRGDGSRGDVHEKQNNFAGIGATGGGVPGERFADIKTGVHAQIQHLVAYSGEHVASPVAKRTEENQDDIIAISKRLGRPVTFGDLSKRWAVGRQYAKDIDAVAGYFRDGYCQGPAVAQDAPPPRPEIVRRFPKPNGLGGPKPDRLAGPETLPWEGEQASPVTQAQATESAPPPSKAPPPAQQPRTAAPPVRTLWSRGKAHEPKAPETTTNAPAVTPDAPAGQQAAAKIAPAPAQPPAAQQHAAPQDENTPAELPTFRIAPQGMEPPSKLGGPVPPPVAAGAAMGRDEPSLPPGTFVEMDPPPVAPGASKVVLTPRAAKLPQAAATAHPGACKVTTASFGGKKTMLLKSDRDGIFEVTALTVLDGFENSMVHSYAKAHGLEATVIGEYATSADAMAEAKSLCPSG